MADAAENLIPSWQQKHDLSFRDTELYLGVSRGTVRTLIINGKLRAYRLGTGERAGVRITRESIEAVRHAEVDYV